MAPFRFKAKFVDVPLFGCVEAKEDEDWHTAFSDLGERETLEISTEQLELVSNEFHLEADFAVTAAAKYTRGEFRTGSEGLGGSNLGDFCEVVTFLDERRRSNEIVRVLSWRKTTASPTGRYPQPDFLVKHDGQFRALEVKGTQALDYFDLARTTGHWRWLQPCARVGPRRVEALEQLGVDLEPRPSHELVLLDDVVPFPVSEGSAHAVLVCDGRTVALRADTRFRTPRACRSHQRDCWKCVDDQTDLVVVRMRNAPG